MKRKLREKNDKYFFFLFGWKENWEERKCNHSK